MRPNTDYREAVAWLENRVNYETFQAIPYAELENRLEMLRDLLEFLGSPDRKYAVVHVAGTKGKGSTCLFLERILREAGYHTGCFSSPHLHSIMERFTTDGVPCEESRFADILFELKNRIETWERTSRFAASLRFPLTYFELTTIFAMEYFARQNTEVAVLEVGMGGRLDSTNVCRPAVTVITSISYDHVEQLGPTLSDIAREKAGIIKPGVPVISGVRVHEREAADTIRTIAASRNAPLYEWGRDFSSNLQPGTPDRSIVFDFVTQSPKFAERRHWDQLESPVWGEHQSRNASLAVAAGILLQERGWTIPEDAVRRGLRAVRLPARMEICARNPLLIVDGAHNRGSVRELIATLKTDDCCATGRKILLFGSMRDKDHEGMLQELTAYFDRIIFTQAANSPRSVPAQELYETARETGEVIPEAAQAFARAKALTGAGDLICVTGSFYLAAEIRSLTLNPQNR